MLYKFKDIQYLFKKCVVIEIIVFIAKIIYCLTLQNA